MIPQFELREAADITAAKVHTYNANGQWELAGDGVPDVKVYSVLVDGVEVAQVWPSLHYGLGPRSWYCENRDLRRRSCRGHGATPDAAARDFLGNVARLEAHEARMREEAADRRKRGVIHVGRPPLPWHTDADFTTWCGHRRTAQAVATIAEVADGDRHRVCQTCDAPAKHHLSWDLDPIGTLRVWLLDTNTRRRMRLLSQLRVAARMIDADLDGFRAEVELEDGLGALLAEPARPKVTHR